MVKHTPVTVDGKNAVVVGGTSGIGEAIALGFATEGANVIATSRSKEKVATTAEKIRDRGATTAEVTCDVTDSTSLENLRDVAVDTFKSVDVLVASQGVISREQIVDISESEWNRVLNVALNGGYRVSQIFAPTLADGEAGNIVHISSLAARLAIADAPAYSAAKGGVDSLTRVSAKELAPDVRVNAIAPGFVITPQNEDEYAEGTGKRDRIDERTPLNRVANREEIVGAAIYLASDAASYTTSEVLTVDGGFATSVF